MNILHLDSGLFLEQSVSRKLSQQIVSRITAEQDQVVYRDLVTDAIPHLDAETLLAEQQPLTQTLLDELFAADVIVIGAPMYNFTIPTQLKAWLDRVLKAGVTFNYTEKGPVGLLQGKKVYIASGRGGIYSTGDAAAMDHQESYLRQALGFIGITDVQVIRAEGVNMGDEPRQQALQAADEAIAALA
ncbi:FMN-dependent NADH-azoreductase [Pseudidiomarina terrestris]|uniref:FMN-dependent NADH-azoreductase n=1 Tax=Pseudidiomarina terrestris TaxID=2820060 RepID=UPI002651C573|nr:MULTISPECIES: FMN-dependent NADH-azoreductase [unclassified Pseudidiomarina]MDN7127140.1 FMN-dependent NADH-azoreductase [Pseudidiomarina sp. 1APR75-33.1]MDN7135447.1 FMN-dependent NADH-azoreductase [Pseudidiomarina sp. 1ASP75-5]MDN7138521.1 FMN-dependent NADH-azoreductase [Pseudidiomarina sp. 1ASP75-14]